MKNASSPPFITSTGKSVLAIAAAVMAFFCILALMAAPAKAETLKPYPVKFNSADGTLLTAWIYRSESAVSRGSVVALHGCGGLYAQIGARMGLINARSQAMAEMLVEQGYAVVYPDSMGPRGETEVCTKKIADRKVDLNHRRADALATMAWVASQPWAKVDSIALLGWSFGGSAVLAATDANHPNVTPQSVKPAVAIAFYPGCSAAMKSHYKPIAPLVMLLGEKDDWTPPAACIALGKAVGADVQVYPGAHHGFDNPMGGVLLRMDVPNEAQGGKSVHAGRDPAAREQSYAYLRQVLRKTFAPVPAATAAVG